MIPTGGRLGPFPFSLFFFSFQKKTFFKPFGVIFYFNLHDFSDKNPLIPGSKEWWKDSTKDFEGRFMVYYVCGFLQHIPQREETVQTWIGSDGAAGLILGKFGVIFWSKKHPTHDLETKYEMGNLKGSLRGSINLWEEFSPSPSRAFYQTVWGDLERGSLQVFFEDCQGRHSWW